MVAGINDMVAVQDYYPQLDQGKPELVGNLKLDDVGNLVVVSKDFILNLLSLAVGKPHFLENNLGKSIDVKV